MGEVDGGLRVSQLTKRWGDFALEADFSVAPGQRMSVFGPSGCGKSTLLRLIAGLTLADSGSVLLGSENVTQVVPERRGIGFMFQEAALFPSMNVIENAAFGLRMRGVSRKEREAQSQSWLEKVGLASKAHASVETLSGGEKQRVAFVRAVVWKPRLLLLDEPFSALDVKLRGELRRELIELHRLWPVPMLFVTHDQAESEALGTARLEWSLKAGGVRSFSALQHSP